jgi:hypothetical protein
MIATIAAGITQGVPLWPRTMREAVVSRTPPLAIGLPALSRRRRRKA